MTDFYTIFNTPQKPAFEYTKFSDLFTEWTKADTTITRKGIKHTYPEILRPDCKTPAYIQCWLTFSGHKFDSLDVLPTQELIEYVDKNMLAIDYDRIYFEIVTRDDCYALRANYNQILGSRLLAIFPLTENFEKDGE